MNVYKFLSKNFDNLDFLDLFTIRPSLQFKKKQYFSTKLSISLSIILFALGSVYIN